MKIWGCKMEEIYVLLINNNINGAGLESDVIVFDDLKLASTKLNELKDNFLQEIKNETDNYTIEDYSNEILPSFMVYENGFDNEHYFELTTFQREINLGV